MEATAKNHEEMKDVEKHVEVAWGAVEAYVGEPYVGVVDVVMDVAEGDVMGYVVCKFGEHAEVEHVEWDHAEDLCAGDLYETMKDAESLSEVYEAQIAVKDHAGDSYVGGRQNAEARDAVVHAEELPCEVKVVVAGGIAAAVLVH